VKEVMAISLDGHLSYAESGLKAKQFASISAGCTSQERIDQGANAFY